MSHATEADIHRDDEEARPVHAMRAVNRNVLIRIRREKILNCTHELDNKISWRYSPPRHENFLVGYTFSHKLFLATVVFSRELRTKLSQEKQVTAYRKPFSPSLADYNTQILYLHRLKTKRTWAHAYRALMIKIGQLAHRMHSIKIMHRMHPLN